MATLHVNPYCISLFFPNFSHHLGLSMCLFITFLHVAMSIISIAFKPTISISPLYVSFHLFFSRSPLFLVTMYLTFVSLCAYLLSSSHARIISEFFCELFLDTCVTFGGRLMLIRDVFFLCYSAHLPRVDLHW